MFTGWGTYYLSVKNLFQHLTILFVKNFFLTPHINQPLVQSHYPLFSCNRPCQKVNIERLQKAVTEAFSSPEWANPTPFPLGVSSFWSFLWPSSCFAPKLVYVFPVLKTAELDVIFQVERRPLWGQNQVPQPAGDIFFDVSQDTPDLLGCRRTLPAFVQLFIQHHLQEFFRRHVSDAFILYRNWGLPQPRCNTLHLAYMGSLLQLIQVLLDSIPFLRCITIPLS